MKGKRAASLLAATSPLIAIGMCLEAVPAAAQEQMRYDFHLPAGSLAAALRSVSRITGRSIAGAADLLAGKSAPALNGSFTVEAAVDRLLAGSGLRARAVGDGLVIEAAPTGGEGASTPTFDIVVTGSRIRGGKVASPVVTVSRDDARNQGQASLGEIARSIPQSFGGGQNPGIGLNVPAASGSDLTGGSSINLRGLGSDATLTLLNGHRLSYSGSRQSVDVSAIPLGAFDRIEVVADGASAIYGSDAVGGVANIILRRDMQGVETRARIGGSTDGGSFSQQYGLTAGARWQGGGFLTAYEFNRTTPVQWYQRDYAINRSIGLMLMPALRSNNVLVSGHQSLGGGFAFTIDGLYNKRHVLLVYPYDPSGNLNISKFVAPTDDESWAVVPALSWSSGNRLHVELSASYGRDRTDYSVSLVTPANDSRLAFGCYCNRALSVELSGDGKLFDLPGGPAKLALGIGYRRTALELFSGAGSYRNFDRADVSHYAFGEVELPLLSPAGQGVRLNVDAAVRYERYRDEGAVATPKVGIVFGPAKWIDLKASWGRSFKAPTLLQRFQANVAVLLPIAVFGGTGYAAGSTGLYVTGGSPSLRPERATSWSLTADLHPAALRGFELQISWFRTRYVDRIVQPIPAPSAALTNPLYAAYVIRNPSAALVTGTVANAGIFQAGNGAVYDPATVVALIDNENLNAGRQVIHGIDALLDYRVDLGTGDRLTLAVNATYLVSNQQIAANQPIAPLAGTIFNPPHWRGRSSIGWQHGPVTLTGTLNYTGSLRDTRSTPPVRVGDQTTFDLALRYRTPDGATGLWRGFDIVLAAQNLFNAAPPLIVTRAVTDTPYDSTNYQPIGRFLSLSVNKKW
ncbi:TonB-dependent receptor [Sphingomonas pruni]|uniref:TonB-dependent receptor n=1 Tax=Sphingomonas pruni TaxID=40683 RepID=UPI00082A06AD|nr:TonB-dependent receptor [Sphingomonas pruni]